MEASNRLSAAFRSGRQTFGMWQMIPNADVSRLLAQTGVDWIVVDCEHGKIDDGAMHDAVPAITSMGVSPIVRLPDTQPWMVKRALDSGAHGILVPLIRTVGEAEDLVRAAKFPPWGVRGLGSPFAPRIFGPEISFTQYLQEANETLLTILQIETKEALEAVDQIAAVKGVDVLFVGPFDLGNSIGHPILDGVMAPELIHAINRILEASKRAGKKSGIYCTGAEQAKEFAALGFDMINIATDWTALEFRLTEQFSVIKGAKRPEEGKSY